MLPAACSAACPWLVFQARACTRTAKQQAIYLILYSLGKLFPPTMTNTPHLAGTANTEGTE